VRAIGDRHIRRVLGEHLGQSRHLGGDRLDDERAAAGGEGRSAGRSAGCTLGLVRRARDVGDAVGGGPGHDDAAVGPPGVADDLIGDRADGSFRNNQSVRTDRRVAQVEQH
jgi:hypothetical protein